jgi:hypothetical protein
MARRNQAPKAKAKRTWWRVAWYRKGPGGDIRGNAKITASWKAGPPNQFGGQTWRCVCYFPMAIYPTIESLPVRRKEIDIWV